MTLEERLEATLADLVDGRFYPDTAPDNASFPLITYQQVGGRDYAYVDGSLPSHGHARIQFNVHGRLRHEVVGIGRLIAKRLVASELPTEIYGSLSTGHDDLTKIYTTRQDFGCWFPQ